MQRGSRLRMPLSVFGSETGVIATPIGTPEIEEQRPDLAQQPTSSPKAWGIADVMDTPLPVSTQSLPVLQPSRTETADYRLDTPALQESSYLQGTPTTNFQNPAIIPFYNPSRHAHIHNPSLQNPPLYNPTLLSPSPPTQNPPPLNQNPSQL